MLNKKVFFSAAMLLTMISVFAASTFRINTAQSVASFTIGGPFYTTVEGKFESGVTGTITFDANDLSTANISASVDVATISTGINMRDKHLRNKTEFFEADLYPTISFSATNVSQAKGGYVATGDFTMKDVTKQVSVPFTFENNVFKGDFKIDRTQFGQGASTGVGDEVSIHFEIPVQ